MTSKYLTSSDTQPILLDRLGNTASIPLSAIFEVSQAVAGIIPVKIDDGYADYLERNDSTQGQVMVWDALVLQSLHHTSAVNEKLSIDDLLIDVSSLPYEDYYIFNFTTFILLKPANGEGNFYIYKNNELSSLIKYGAPFVIQVIMLILVGITFLKAL